MGEKHRRYIQFSYMVGLIMTKETAPIQNDPFFDGINKGDKPMIGITLPDGTRIVSNNPKWIIDALPTISPSKPVVIENIEPDGNI